MSERSNDAVGAASAWRARAFPAPGSPAARPRVAERAQPRVAERAQPRGAEDARPRVAQARPQARERGRSLRGARRQSVATYWRSEPGTDGPGPTSDEAASGGLDWLLADPDYGPASTGHGTPSPANYDENVRTDDQAVSASQSPVARLHPARAHWPGAGGRWLVWVGRAVVWALLLLIGYRGVLAIVDGQQSPAATAAQSASHRSTFPESLAQAYALEFGEVYLSFSPATAAARGQELATFLPPGTDQQMGWNGAGTQHLLSEQVASVTITNSHTAVVTLLARLGSGRIVALGVPIYAAQGAMVVSGMPALLPGPAKAVPPQTGSAPDVAVQAALQSQLPAFFEAYASGDWATLARFLWPGEHARGLDGLVTFGGIDSVYVPAGGARRQISVTVTWNLPSTSVAQSAAVAAAPASLQMTYEMTVVRQGSTWDVQSIGASTQAHGPP